MKVAVPKEIVPNERRVALVPQTVAKLVASGLEVLVESGAGDGAFFFDRDYAEAGARIVSDPAPLYGEADAILKVQRPIHIVQGPDGELGEHEVELMAKGAVLIAFLQPLTNLDLVQLLAEKGITSFSMDAIPRIARAQSMDALSSMSTLAGYQAVLIAAGSMGKLFPMMITAAGTFAPAKGLVIGAGVAGLQAIATSHRLGAVMYAYDVRPAVKEQVQSLGATFIEGEPLSAEVEDKSGYAKELAKDAQQRERELLHKHVKDMDFIVTTALIPGSRAPILITKEMVGDMRAGSVIVDIAAEMGGNCELTRPGQVIKENGVTINGPLNLPGAMPIHASQMYSRNISNLLQHLVKAGNLNLDFEDHITKGCCITHDGRIIHEPTMALAKP